MVLAETVPVPAVPPVNQAAQLIFTLAQIPLVVLTICYGVAWARRYRTAAPCLILVGGLGMAAIEPLVDHNGLCWFAPNGQLTAYVAFGVHQPVWLVMAYVWFFGGQTMLLWRKLEDGFDPARLPWFAAAVFAVDALLEHAGLIVRLYRYYGNQPFDFGGFPLWWGFLNSTTPIVAATVVYVLRPHLTGWRAVTLVPVSGVVASAAVNAGAGLPVWTGLNSAVPAWTGWILALVTLGICLALGKCAAVAVRLHRQAEGAQPGAPAPLRAGLLGS